MQMPVLSQEAKSMDKATLMAYRERWKLVEAYQYAEQRAKTIEQRWIALNQLWQFAQSLPVQQREDPETDAIRQRWAILKQRLPAAERQKLRKRIQESTGVLPFEVESVQRATTRQLGMLQVQLPTPEDLIIYKAVAHRLKDRQDIYDIIQTNPNLDRKRIRYWVQQFAEVLEMPELWEDIAPWLK
jgi:hypothetical protein